MRLYVRFIFSSDGMAPLDVIELAKEMGFTPEIGDYDCSTPLDSPDRYGELVVNLHKALKGSMVRYTLATRER